VKENETHTGFVVAPQTAKVTVLLDDKCLIKMEKALNDRVLHCRQFQVTSTGLGIHLP
jgi:hypothetical protein